MGVRIVSVYDNPTLLETFTAPVLTVPGNVAVSNGDLLLYYPGSHPGFESPGVDPSVARPNNEWFKGIGPTTPPFLQLVAHYYFPKLIKPGIWTLDIDIALNTAGELPGGYDPETECEYWRFLGFGIIQDLLDLDPSFPWSSIDVEEGGLCDFSDTGGLTLTASVGIADYRSPCRCGEGVPVFGVARGEHTLGSKSQLSSWDITLSGVWDSDFPP